jgi:Ribosomal protein S8
MSHDITADVLNQIMNCKKAKKPYCEVSKYSKFLINVLDIAKQKDYIDYSLNEKDKKLRITIKKVNECKAIKPRFNVEVNEIDKYVRRFLPARNFGIILISTSSGLMIHENAYKKNVGGSLIAYFY